MKRLIQSALLSLAAISLCLGTPMVASAGHMGTHHRMKHSCPAGQHWVKGYTKKDGTHVKGYCRT
ncbi:MAG: hypothetical protein JO165_10130 [Candidatus Eremiobacteraeota bacterium]|nr:hypothetical protein [Candidatus Eremiobacteraeota bacterium]